MDRFNDVAARPRTGIRRPAYPRLLGLGLLLTAAACGGKVTESVGNPDGAAGSAHGPDAGAGGLGGGGSEGSAGGGYPETYEDAGAAGGAGESGSAGSAGEGEPDAAMGGVPMSPYESGW